MKHATLRVCVGLITLCSFGAAQAAGIVAELHQIEGKVLVNGGKGFMLAGAVKAGDKILIGDNSHVVVSYPNGCDIPLASKQIYVVHAKPPCGMKAKVVQQTVVVPPALPPVVPIAPVAASGLSSSLALPLAAVGLGAVAVGGLVLFSRPAASP